MLQTSLQNDTVLKQLHQAVEINSSKTLDVSRQLIAPASVRYMDSIVKKDTLSGLERSFAPVLKKQNSLKALVARRDTFTMPPVIPIQSEDVVVLLTEDIGKPTIVLPENKIERNTPDWEVGVFIIVLALFATVRLFFGKYLSQLTTSTVNYATASRMFRERTTSITHASFRLDVIFHFVFSLFLFQAFDTYNVDINLSSFLKYLIIIGGVLGYFALKKIAYFLLGNLNESAPDTLEYLFNMNLYNRILGLVLLPVSLVVAFAPLANPRLVVVCGLFVIVAFYILLIFRGVKILMRKHFSIFYLILYLCTLEILPLLFIYKLVLV